MPKGLRSRRPEGEAVNRIDYLEGRRYALRTLEPFALLRTRSALDAPIANLRQIMAHRPGLWADGIGSVLRELGE